MNKYYEQNKEEILKKCRERYLKKKLQNKDKSLQDEINCLNKKIEKLIIKVEYYQQQARTYRHQRTEANKTIKELQEKLKNSVPKQTGPSYQKTIETIKKLEELLKDTKQPHLLYQARLKQLNKLKESIGMPIYTACAFD